LKACEFGTLNKIKIEQEVTIDPYDLIFVDIALKEK